MRKSNCITISAMVLSIVLTGCSANGEETQIPLETVEVVGEETTTQEKQEETEETIVNDTEVEEQANETETEAEADDTNTESEQQELEKANTEDYQQENDTAETIESENRIEEAEKEVVAETSGLESAEANKNIAENEATDSSQEGSEKIDVETAWELLREEYFSFYELNEITYDEFGNINIVVCRAEDTFGEEETERPFEDIVFFDMEEDGKYLFGCYRVYYSGEEVFATKTIGWYYVNATTGEVEAM